MIEDPPRLRDDPDFIATSGCTLSDLDVVLDGYDLERMRTHVTAPPPPLRPRPWRLGAAAAVGTGGIVLLAWLARPAEPEPPIALPPPAIPLEVSVVDVPPDARSAPPVLARPPARARPAERAADIPVVAPVPAAAPPAFTTTAPVDRSLLQDELDAYARAEEARAAGDAEATLTAVEAYLGAWPGGHLQDEAALLRIGAYAQLGRWSEVEAGAAALAGRASMAAKRPEVDRLRAEALVGLGRCEEAAQLVADHPDRAVRTAVRRACRSHGR